MKLSNGLGGLKKNPTNTQNVKSNIFLLSICPDVVQKVKDEGLNPMACGFVLQPIRLVHNH